MWCHSASNITEKVLMRVCFLITIKKLFFLNSVYIAYDSFTELHFYYKKIVDIL